MKKFLSRMTALSFFTLLAICVSALFNVSFAVAEPVAIAFALLIPVQKGVLALNSTNNWSARQSFDHARTMFAKAMLDKFGGNMQAALRWANSLKLSQNEIRTEVQLTTTAQTFNLGVTVNQASQGATGLFNTEKRLELQDSLCIAEYGIFVRKPASATSTIDPLCTFGDANTFSTANVATALNTFYDHGQFRITVNNDVVLPARGIFNHKYIPQTQNAVGVTAQTIFPLSQIRGAEDGFVTCEPNIVLIGSKNYTPQIILPVSLAAVETFQRAVVIFRGILAQNSTVIN